MIGNLRGTIIHKTEVTVTIDVSGVGYVVNVPVTVLENISMDAEVSLLTHLVVRDDALVLYGFVEEKQLKLFELLIGVSGVGPKMALSIISTYDVGQINEAVAGAQAEVFQAIPGIGKKNAQRIIVDLQPRIGVLAELDFADTKVSKDLVEGLVGLGYGAREVREVLKDLEESLSEDQKIKEALRRLAR